MLERRTERSHLSAFLGVGIAPCCAGSVSLVMTSHLLDHLKPGPYMNLFVQLVYLRGILSSASE